MNRVKSNESFDIRLRPRWKRLIAFDELGVVAEEGEPLAPEILVTVPMLFEERLW